MPGLSIFFTPNGIIVAGVGRATEAALARLEQGIANGEVYGVVVNVANNAAPAIDVYGNVQSAVEMSQSYARQDWNALTRDAFAATLGMIAGVAAMGTGPTQAVAISLGVEKLFKDAYDLANDFSKNKDWGGLFDLIDDFLDIWNNHALLPDPMIPDDLWDDLTKNPAINTNFLGSRSAVVRRAPLALDLDGDDLETVGIGGNPILFDHDGDGVRTGTGWLQGDDAFLALDRNGNGTIDNGGELFGVDTVLANGQTATNGFAALADLDSNHDGQFSNLDAQFANVKVWRDLNQDGSSQSNELQTLATAGIASISLSSTATNVALGNGNVQSAAGSFTKTNGQSGSVGEFTTGASGNLDLAQNPFYSEFTTPTALTAAARALPGMHGSGMVRDLQEAASLSAALLADVTGLNGTTRAQMHSRIDTLLADWANTSTLKTSMADAASRNFALVYLPPGMSAIDYLTLQSDTLFLAPAAEQARLRALEAQQQQYTNLIGILERFNGLQFVTVTDSAVTTGQGQMVAAAAPTGGPAVPSCPVPSTPSSTSTPCRLRCSTRAMRSSGNRSIADWSCRRG